MIKFNKRNQIKLEDWDDLVKNTYGKPYSFQQQDDCRNRGIFTIEVPSDSEDEEYNDSIPEEINGEEMGVKFNVWLNTNPKEHQERNNWDNWKVNLFWERNFYPDIYTLINDLYSKGLIEKGEYDIKIDW